MTLVANIGNNIRQLSPLSELKEKNITICWLYYPNVSKLNILNFSVWRFFPFATGVNDTGVAPLSYEYLREFLKKIETVLIRLIESDWNWFKKKTLKVPKCEIFDPFFFTPINPIWVGDLRTGEIKKNFRRLRQIFAILFFLRRLSLR